MNVQGNEGVALAGEVSVEFLDFPLVQQEFSGAGWQMVSGPGLFIGGDIDSVEEDLIIPFYSGKAFIEADLSVADALDLCAEQDYSGFGPFEDEIVVDSLAVDYPRQLL